MLERLTVGPIGVNAYVIGEGASCLLVDPGDEAPRLLSFLDSRGLSPAAVVLTHGHLDHMAALPELLAAWRGRGLAVPLAVHPSDAQYLGPGSEEATRLLFQAVGALDFFAAYWKPMPSPDILLADGDALPGCAFRVVHSPGHSAGSICLYDAGAGMLLSGDTLFRGGIGRTDCPDSDPAAMESSLESLLGLPPETRVFPGHGRETTIGREAGSLRLG